MLPAVTTDPASEALLRGERPDTAMFESSEDSDDESGSGTDTASMSLLRTSTPAAARQSGQPLTSSALLPRSSQPQPQHGGVMTNLVAPASIKVLKVLRKLKPEAVEASGTNGDATVEDGLELAESATVDERRYSFQKTVYLGRYRTNATCPQLSSEGEMTAGIAPFEQNGTKPALTDPSLPARAMALFQQSKRHSIKSIFSRSKDTRSGSQANILGDDEAMVKGKRDRTFLCCSFTKIHRLLQFLVEDWMFLALLGIIMALLSFGMDWAIEWFQTEHANLMDLVATHGSEYAIHVFFEYLIWVFYAILLVTASALFAHYVAPQAIGSGIPEMKTILRGVILKEYLTFRTLVSKVVGLTFSLGSGLPIGKEGPFVHVASVVANLLSHLVHSINNGYANESRSSEMLAAGCAVGVACTFSAPVGGVLFSIEVTSVYFAIRNYWRGFFAATCSATVFRLLRVFNNKSVTVIAFYQTDFPREESFLPSELPLFGLIGIIAGFMAALFIYMQRRLILFLRRNTIAKAIFQKYWLIYPIVISLVVSSITFPDGFGRFIGGSTRFSKTAVAFFDTCTFRESNVTSDRYCGDAMYNNWTDNGNISVFTSLSLFLVTYYFLACVASTVPIPAGIFGPAFILGSSLGRLVGEIVAYTWTDRDIPVYPGIYAVVGAAAFGGGVTHTVSVAVIVFELTGQIVYILPVMIAVLLANAICSYLQPSIYDSMIKIKHLPYLPDIPHSSSNFHGIKVDQFMVSDVKFLSKDSTYAEVQELLLEKTKLRAFPIVEDRSSCILIGSCSRAKLLRALNKQAGPEARQAEALNRVREDMLDIERRFKSGDRSIEPRPSLFATLALDPLSFVVERKSASVERPQFKNTDNDSANQGKQFQVTPVSNSTPKKAPIEDFEDVYIECPSPPRGDQPPSPPPTRKTTMDTLAVPPLTTTTSRRSVLSALLRRDRNKSTPDFEATPNPTGNSQAYNTIHGLMNRTFGKMSFGRFKINREAEHGYDLLGEERILWEINQLAQTVDLDDIVDPAPFQLVENSSLFKVHSLFSLLGLNRAYVTNCGRLVGVVALSDLRKAIEAVQAGTLYSGSPSIYDVNKEFEGSHLVGPGAEALGDDDDETDEDVDNDMLNPRLEVINRVESCLTPGELSQIQELVDRTAEIAEAAAKVSELQERLDKTKLSIATSDPCIATRFNDSLENGRPHATPPPKVVRRFSVQPVFSLGEPESPGPVPVPPATHHLPTLYESRSPSPSILATSSPSTASMTGAAKKKPRHVHIVVPPTPDDEKTDSTHFDFNTKS
uniref:Chloride channel protein n=1 Tax=Panagrellus redivivus TaxID=6233 RepID=A0A7E4VJ60_PANRE